MKRNVKKLASILLVITQVSIISTGCATLDAILDVTSEDSDTQSKYTDASRTVTITNVDQYKNDMVNMIETGTPASECIEDFEFNENDITSAVDLKQYYYFNNAIYLQVNDKYMYRFQLDDNDKVASYIKYSILGQ
jgi:hypothetical protein